jgi:hypothetical protein
MDDTILRDLVKQVPSLRTTKMSRDESLHIDDLINSTRDLSGTIKDTASHGMSSSRRMNMSAVEVSFADLNFNMDEDSPSAREENHVLQQLAKTAEQMTMVSGSKTVSLESRTATRRSLAPERPSLEKPELGGQRNTCGTLYVGSTMSAPDKDATIKVREPMHALRYDTIFLSTLDSFITVCLWGISCLHFKCRQGVLFHGTIQC